MCLYNRYLVHIEHEEWLIKTTISSISEADQIPILNPVIIFNHRDLKSVSYPFFSLDGQ